MTLEQLEDALLRYCPSRQWEIREVTFPSNANTDLDIAHGLEPLDPENVDFVVLRSAQPVLVYADSTATRTAWSTGVIRLRCTGPSAKVVLLLTVGADGSARELLGEMTTFELSGASPFNTLITGIGLTGSTVVSDAGIGYGLFTKSTANSHWCIHATNDPPNRYLNFADVAGGKTPMQIRKSGTNYWVRPGPVSAGTITASLGDPDPSFSDGVWDNLYVDVIYESGRSTAMGTWTSVAHAGGNFTASGAMTWTVDSADQLTFAYTLVGKTMTVSISLSGTTPGGVASTDLKVAIPGSFTAAKSMFTTGVGLAHGGTDEAIQVFVAASGTTISFRRMGGANWVLGSNGTDVRATITFEIQ